MQTNGTYWKVEMLKGNAYWAIGIATLMALHCIPATASEFSSYEECILEKMGGVTSNVAAEAIKQACYKLTNPQPKKYECGTMSGEDAPDIESHFAEFPLFNDYIVMDFYNRSKLYHATSITLVMTFDTKNTGRVVREFTAEVYAKPQTMGKLRLYTGVHYKEIKDIRWQLKSASGCKY